MVSVFEIRVVHVFFRTFFSEIFCIKPTRYCTVVILLKATKHAERKQINKSHWLNNVSRDHFIGGERFPKHQFLVF